MIEKKPIASHTQQHFNHLTALASIHDVTSATLPEVMQIIEVLKVLGIPPATLLVVPGGEWTAKQLATLRHLQNNGFEIAGHGWTHRCSMIKTLEHRIHSVIFSGNVAEHLSLESEQIVDIIHRCYRWFQESDIKAPELYVPPAWAIGKVSRKTLKELPFNMYECLSGIYDSRTDSFMRLPLAGYEVDTQFRTGVLRTLNLINYGLAAMLGLPLRIAIHPFDFRRGMGSDLKARLNKLEYFINYADIDFKKTFGRIPRDKIKLKQDN
ncbi:MAG: polysaccharide deacetylase family protein [Desulfobacterales bacterium]|jgi:predicted deacetylase